MHQTPRWQWSFAMYSPKKKALQAIHGVVATRPPRAVGGAGIKDVVATVPSACYILRKSLISKKT
jgi:hypothetical protein